LLLYLGYLFVKFPEIFVELEQIVAENKEEQLVQS